MTQGWTIIEGLVKKLLQEDGGLVTTVPSGPSLG